MAGNFFRGTSVEQDGRWAKAEDKLMSQMTKDKAFAPILNTKVDLKKVNLDVIFKWVTQKIEALRGEPDEILASMIINMCTPASGAKALDGKKMQMNLAPFLLNNCAAFVAELWTLLVDAQSQPSGIPSVFIEQKKQEILQREQVREANSSNSRFEKEKENDTGSAPNNAHSERKVYGLQRRDGDSQRAPERSDRRARSASPSRRRLEDNSRDRHSHRRQHDEGSHRSDYHSRDRDRGRDRERERERDRRQRYSDSPARRPSHRTSGRDRSEEHRRRRRSPSSSSSSSSSSEKETRQRTDRQRRRRRRDSSSSTDSGRAARHERRRRSPSTSSSPERRR